SDEPRAETLAPVVGVDLGVGEDERAAGVVVVGDADHVAVEPQLVAGPVFVVVHLQVHCRSLPPIGGHRSSAARSGREILPRLTCANVCSIIARWRSTTRTCPGGSSSAPSRAGTGGRRRRACRRAPTGATARPG